MKKLVLFTFLFLSFSAKAEGWICWRQASERYGIPVELLYAIARVESGNRAYVINHNRDGSYDIGVMQINSRHLPSLSKYGITESRLIEDPCLNVHVGAWILAEKIAKYGFTWRAVGAYNASGDHKQLAYSKKVIKALEEISLVSR